MSKTGTDQLQSLFRSDIFMNMNAVGIDVSKRKSTVAILRPGGKAVGKPFDVPHLSVKQKYAVFFPVRHHILLPH